MEDLGLVNEASESDDEFLSIGEDPAVVAMPQPASPSGVNPAPIEGGVEFGDEELSSSCVTPHTPVDLLAVEMVTSAPVGIASMSPNSVL